MLKTLCPQQDLTNEDHLWFLNICFAQYYVHELRMKRNIQEELRLASYQLAKLGECFFLNCICDIRIRSNDTHFYYGRTHPLIAQDSIYFLDFRQ